MTIAFWLLLAAVLYAYVGYPPTAAAAAWLLDRRVAKDDVTPGVSVIVAAYDEAEVIADRVRNVLGSDYPPERLEMIVASDGSTDSTVARASGIDSARVRVLDLPRRGKAAALAAAARHARGEVLVFTDANTTFRADALRMLVRSFADPSVGGVAGRSEYVVPEATEAAGRGESLYWRYDTWLRTLESRTGSVVSAHGGIYAIRRRYFRPVEDPAVTDDFAISTGVVEQGGRLVFEPAAVAYERPMERSASEFRRRVRLMTRGLRGVVLRRALLDPLRHGFYSVALASRKVLRRVVSLAHPPLFVTAIVAAGEGTLFAGAVVAAQAAIVGLGLTGWVLRRTPLGTKAPLYVPFFFCMANVAAAIAFWNLIRGARIERWTPQRHGGQPRHSARGSATGARVG